jgi:hypothetical protein
VKTGNILASPAKNRYNAFAEVEAFDLNEA